MNSNQKKAVKWKDGPVLTLAGPGSGKTFVLTNRILNLITEYGVDPQNILIITFTRAAANEMKQRFIKLLAENKVAVNDLPTFGTFHSVFFEILRDNFDYNENSLIKKEDEVNFLLNILSRNKKIIVKKELVDSILKDIKKYKSSLEKKEVFIPKSIDPKNFQKIYEEYQEELFNNRKLDFNDMIMNCAILLKKYPQVLKFYQDKYKYILIDEFQDINIEQYDIVKLLAKSKNLFIVGDDDQSIYGFRGSDPKIMKNFTKDYRNAKIIRLNENYRCSKIVVKFSKEIIENNSDRFAKDLVAKKDIRGVLEFKAFIDSKEENEYLLDKINYYRHLGIELKEMAILYRTNILSRSIISTLKKNNIDYECKDDGKFIYDSFCCKDMMSYLKLSVDEYDVESIISIINKPMRYVSRDAIGSNNVNIDSIMKEYKNNEIITKKLLQLKNDINKLSHMSTVLAIQYIRKNMGYDDYLQKYCREKKLDFEEIDELLDTFMSESIGHNDIEEFLWYIDNLKKEKSEKKNSDENVEKEEKNALKLMTFHTSKGLEFKVVFIIDANDGIIPHKKSLKDGDVETERRLFYVAMTRASENLHIFWTSRRFGKNYKVSRFIIEAMGGKNGKQRKNFGSR